MEYTVAAVQEALSLLMLVAQSPGLGVTEYAKRSGNTKARAYRLLTTLAQSGFIQRHQEGATYSLGNMTLVLGLAAQEQVSLVKLGSAYLEQLQVQFNESVQVLVRDGLESVCVAKRECAHDLRINNMVGRRRPLHAGASGKVLLAFSPPELQRTVINGELNRFTSNTTISKSKLTQELARIRSSGHAVSYGEMALGVVALAAPVFDVFGNAVAALSISLPESRLPDSLEEMTQVVVACAASLSRDLGYQDGHKALASG